MTIRTGEPSLAVNVVAELGRGLREAWTRDPRGTVTQPSDRGVWPATATPESNAQTPMAPISARPQTCIADLLDSPKHKPQYREDREIEHREHSDPGEHRARQIAGRAPIEKRQDDERRGSQSERENADELAFDAEDMWLATS